MVEFTLFTLDETSKKLIKQIACKMQVPIDVIKSVYEYTLFNVALDLLNNQKKLKEIAIPYFGKLVLKPNENLEGDFKYDSFFVMSENLKNTLKSFEAEDYSVLEKFLDKKIEKALNSVD